jgi:hypothetical protein
MPQQQGNTTIPSKHRRNHRRGGKQESWYVLEQTFQTKHMIRKIVNSLSTWKGIVLDGGFYPRDYESKHFGITNCKSGA